MSYRYPLLTGAGLALLAAAPSAFAQDATIYYRTPTVRAGQPVENPRPRVVEAVPVYTPVPVAVPAAAPPQAATASSADPATATQEGFVRIPATAPTLDATDYLGTPPVQTSQHDSTVTFVTGGIGAFEKSWFDAHTGDYRLKVTYTDKTGHHLAGVQVQLTDTNDRIMMRTITDGPYLLVDAKPGSYILTSTYQGTSTTKKVTLGKGTTRTSVAFTDL